MSGGFFVFLLALPPVKVSPLALSSRLSRAALHSPERHEKWRLLHKLMYHNSLSKGWLRTSKTFQIRTLSNLELCKVRKNDVNSCCPCLSLFTHETISTLLIEAISRMRVTYRRSSVARCGVSVAQWQGIRARNPKIWCTITDEDVRFSFFVLHLRQDEWTSSSRAFQI